MRHLLLLSLLLLGLRHSALAALPGLGDVLAARKLLSSGSWSRVLRVEHEGKDHTYPKSFYALVFEMASVLWVYAPQTGTQSLSQTVGTTLTDRSRVPELMKDVLPGVSLVLEEPGEVKGEQPSKGKPNNACFIESLAALEERMKEGGRPDSAQLFSYYYEYRKRRYGHTVLTYAERGRCYVVDSAREEESVLEVDGSLVSDPAALANRICPEHKILSTRSFPLPLSSANREKDLLTGLSSQSGPVL